MVIGNFYIERVSFFPDETDPPLVVNPDAVLTRPLFLKPLGVLETVRYPRTVPGGLAHMNSS